MVKDHFLRQLWISSGVIVVSILAAAYGIYFYSGDLSAQADKIVNDRAVIQQQTDSIGDLANLERAVPQAAQYQAAMNRLLPDQYGIVTLGEWFTQTGGKYGVSANAQLQGGSALSPQGLTPGSASFSFDAEGPPASLLSFLDEISSKSPGFLISLGQFDFTNSGTSAKVTGHGIVFFR